jgi:hypothetical protein
MSERNLFDIMRDGPSEPPPTSGAPQVKATPAVAPVAPPDAHVPALDVRAALEAIAISGPARERISALSQLARMGVVPTFDDAYIHIPKADVPSGCYITYLMPDEADELPWPTDTDEPGSA